MNRRKFLQTIPVFPAAGAILGASRDSKYGEHPSHSNSPPEYLAQRIAPVVSGAIKGAMFGYMAHRVVRRLPDLFEYFPLPESDVPISLEAASSQYEKFYDRIKEAKEVAERDNKRLVILIGEDHVENLSLLHNMMIADAASRLGILDFVSETELTQEKLDERQQGIAETKKMNADTIISAMNRGELTFANPEDEELIGQYLRLPKNKQTELDASVLALNATRFCMPHGGQHGSYFDYFVAMLGYHTPIDGDPIRKMDKERLDRHVEDPMIEAVSNIPQSCVACYGLAHIPPLYKALKKSDRVYVLTFDTSNREVDVPDGYPDSVKRRYKELQALYPEIEKPMLVGRSPTVQETALIAICASLLHRVKAEEMGEERGKQLTDMTKRLHCFLEKHVQKNSSREVVR